MCVKPIREEKGSTVALTREDPVQNHTILSLVCICCLHLCKHTQAETVYLHSKKHHWDTTHNKTSQLLLGYSNVITL